MRRLRAANGVSLYMYLVIVVSRKFPYHALLKMRPVFMFL